MSANSTASLIVCQIPLTLEEPRAENLVGEWFSLKPEKNVLGRSSISEVTILLPFTGINRQHLRIWCEDNQWMLEDNKSRNGTYINRIRVTGRPVPLKDRDVIRVCDCELWFRLGTPWVGWLTPTVLALARCVSEEKRPDVLPFLGDALEEAGCEEHEVLTHCRAPLRPGRSSWVPTFLITQSRIETRA